MILRLSHDIDRHVTYRQLGHSQPVSVNWVFMAVVNLIGLEISINYVKTIFAFI